MQQCKPVRCAAVEDPSQIRRFLFCSHYDTCLEHAVKSNWDNFSCEECQCYERVEWDGEQWAEDHSRCLKLAYFVAFEKMKSQLRNSKVKLPETLTPSFPTLELSLVPELV